MVGGSNYMFDVYTEIDGGRAVGITHGYIPIDFEYGDGVKNFWKKKRESEFPLDRILQSINVDVKQAEASVESDRRFILNTITGRPTDDEVLNTDGNYDDLNNILRGIFVKPALERIIEERDVEKITRCLEIVKVSNAKIIDMDLMSCSTFDDEVLMKLSDSLPSTLTEFRLRSKGSAVTVNGINACLGNLMKCPQLVELNLMDNIIDDDGAKMIADALKINQSLEALGLSWNNIGDCGTKMIANALKFNQSLELLNLGGNKIGDVGATMIAEVLKVNHSLRSLDLISNKIGDDGAKEIAGALKINVELRSLYLINNKILNDGARMIADALIVNHSLKVLDLSYNKVADDGAKHFADAIKVNHKLETLGLGGNNIGDDGAKEIAEAMKINHCLKSLNLNKNKISDDVTKMIADALKVNYSLETLYLRENKISADGKEYISKIKQELKDANRDIFIYC